MVKPKKDFKLRTIYFYITGGCNLRCRHCWITPDSNKDDIDTEGVKELVRQAVAMGVKHIKLTGGEPFLRKDIFEILHFMKEKDIGLTIETNGTFISDKEAMELKSLNVFHISVSIDSFDSKFHDDFRGLKGSFDASTKAIKALRKAGFNPQMITSLYKENIKDVEHIAIFAESIGAGSLKLNPISAIGRGKDMDNNRQLLTIEELLELERNIDTFIQKKVKIPILLDIPLAFKKLEYIKKHRGICGLLNIIGILSDGTISICGIGTQVPALNMGNIRRDRLKDIWGNNKILISIREDIPDNLEGVCSKCIFKRLCLGKCRADAYYRTSKLTAPFYFCQEAYEKGLFPEVRLYNQEVFYDRKKEIKIS